MENGLTTTGGNQVAAYQKNVWEDFGESDISHILGKLLKFNKGDWVAGQNNDEIDKGTKMVAIMESLLTGHVRWEDSRPAEHRMASVGKGEKPEPRKSLGFLDKSEWEDGPNGQPMDPWQETFYLVMVNPANREVFTFTTASGGGRRAIKDLCSVYGKRIREKPDEYPIVTLDSDSYSHRDKTVGRVKVPEFGIDGWVKAAQWAAIAEGAAAVQATEERESDIPFDSAATAGTVVAAADELEDIPAALDRRQPKGGRKNLSF